jgi:hypothetical protein
MVRFLVGWAVISTSVGLYLRKKHIELKINRDIVTLVLAFIITLFFTSIQWLFEFIVGLIF